MRPERRAGAAPGLPGWERLRHGGLLLDGTRLATLAREVPARLDESVERQLRQRAGAMLDGGGDGDGGAASSFVAFVLEEVCGLDASDRDVDARQPRRASWGRRAITGETVKPRHLCTGENGGRIPVFLDEGPRLGVGRGRRVVSRVLGWLRASGDHLAFVTNGRQWRLVFAGLDYDAWCEWDLDLWFEEGELSPQVDALRTLLSSGLWMPTAEDAVPPLLQAIRDTRKGQAELSEVLGERVREAVEILIRGHGKRCLRWLKVRVRSSPSTTSTWRTPRGFHWSKPRPAKTARPRSRLRKTSTAPPAGWRCGSWWSSSRSRASCCPATTPSTTGATG